MNIYYKYPRTPHLAFSSPTSDDKMLDNHNHFIGKRVIVSTKLDGESTTLYPDHIHARSIDSGYHPSRTFVKALHGSLAYKITDGYRICGESLQAKHSIYYKDLLTYFFVFGVYNEHNFCLSWEDTVEYTKNIGLQTVPVLYDGIWDEHNIRSCYTGKTIIGGIEVGEAEGFVVRAANSFAYEDHYYNVAKFVSNHFKPGNIHWSQTTYEPNGIKK
jgi:hypothetical protein